ncbi:dephospho-CoA kinase [Bacillus tianshenii]|uniref:Dephospho-CoA kinase n=1 Tax=Sutcliffiella tianshenii TaxID=1463404 RepID=A0ABS2P1R6_9BACI|nr:dephospho-CoA kinase [Bacillus tianshenii]MBM7620548.1 dephospho-CoA kinase [Bacillus tianshenii]
MIIGLTGGIASGKSTVAAMLKEYGLPIVDADVVARQVVEVGEETYNKLVSVFGEEILQEDKSLDRVKLGKLIFENKEKRERLNSIMHPSIRNRMKEESREYQEKGHRTVVMDIPLLFESKLTHLVEKTLLVYVDEAVQLERLMKRNSLSKEDAMARITSQMPLREKVDLADEVIQNNGSLEETKEQLHDILKKWAIQI